MARGKKLSNTPRIAECEVCDEQVCERDEILIRGDQVSFVSVEQAKRTGVHKLNDRKMPSDIVLPSNFVIAQDPTGKLLNACDVYVLRWHNSRSRGVSNAHPELRKHAADYFGRGAPVQFGNVDIPETPWQRVAKVQFIRYRRPGNLKGMYEHEYTPAVWLYDSQKPLAWRLPLPEGCVITAHGFVKP